MTLPTGMETLQSDGGMAYRDGDTVQSDKYITKSDGDTAYRDGDTAQSDEDTAYRDGDTAQNGLCSVRFCPMMHLWEDQTAEGTWSSTPILQSLESEDRC